MVVTEPEELIARAIDRNFTSPNVSDSNFEAANIVDVLNYIANGIHRIADELSHHALIKEGIEHMHERGGYS